MSTAEYPDALTRRIELLAAASVEEPEGESTAVAALVGVLRAEIGAVRAELGSLRAETGAVRSDLDGLGGRLTGSVAASRSETGTLVRRVAELSTRIDGVGGRVDDVRNGLPSLSRELREGLSDVPTRTSARIDELSSQLTEAVAGRVDAVAADIHRTLNAALEREARTTAAATAALEDARGALEGRLAVLEDALDSMSERLEAFARDGARTTTDKLTALEAGVRLLSTRIEDEGRNNAELLVGRLRDVTETRLSELESTLFDRLSDVLRLRNDELRRDVLGALEASRTEAAEDREAVQELASSVRAALDGFSAVLDRSLVGLGRSVSGALADGRQEDRSRLDDLSGALLDAMAAVQADVAQRDLATTALLTAVQGSVEAKVEAVRGQLGTAMTVLRSDVATEVGTLTPRVDELVVAGASTSEALRALRSDVVTATEGLRDRLVAASTDSTEVLRAAMTETRAEVAEITRALREDLLDRIEEKYSGVAERLAELAVDVTAGTASAREVTERVAALGQLSEQSRRAVEQVRTGVVAATEALAEDVTARSDRQLETLAAGTATLSEAVEARLAALDDALSRRLGSLEATVTRRSDELQGSMTGRVDELTGAVTGRVDELQGSMTSRVDELRDGVTGRVGELEQALSARLGELGGQVDESTTRTRVSSEAVAELTELAARHQDEVQRLLEGVRADVVGSGNELRETLLRTTEERLTALSAQLAEVDASAVEQQAAVAVRLGVLDATVTRAVETASETAEAVTGLDATTSDLEQTVGGFRAEWPTRTFEVVQGAKAVAEGVVREVREQVAAQLEQVRAELARAAGGVDEVREDVAFGTDRLSAAGDVLVAYLEQRDRLLEAERDRVLHDVLDTFASGLSAKDRAALSGRVGDAVARRRDARDAERYRTAVGQPVAPSVDVPADVRRIGERAPTRAPASAAPAAPSPSPADPQDAVQRPRPTPGPTRAVSTAKVALPKVAGAAPGGSVVARPAAARTGPPVTAKARAASDAGQQQAPSTPTGEDVTGDEAAADRGAPSSATTGDDRPRAGQTASSPAEDSGPAAEAAPAPAGRASAGKATAGTATKATAGTAGKATAGKAGKATAGKAGKAAAGRATAGKATAGKATAGKAPAGKAPARATAKAAPAKAGTKPAAQAKVATGRAAPAKATAEAATPTPTGPSATPPAKAAPAAPAPAEAGRATPGAAAPAVPSASSGTPSATAGATSAPGRPTTAASPAATAPAPAPAPAPRPAGSKPSPGKPSPGPSATGPAASASTRPATGADRRARVDVMPEVRSPAVAIEAAAPTPAPPRPSPTARSAEDTTQTSWGSRPAAEPGEPEDDDVSMRRLFRRRKP